MKRVIIRGPVQRATAHRYIDEAPEGHEVVIDKHEPQKSDAQRSYWHVLLNLLSREIGEPVGRIKNTVKADALGAYFCEDMRGRLYLDLPSSEKAKREMYSQLIDHTLQYAAEEHGVYLPPPRWNA